MQRVQVELRDDFKVIAGNTRAQAAVMVIAPGESEGGPRNRHRGADQWLYVLSGEGLALIDGETHTLQGGTLLLVERGETHEIRNTGRDPLRTLNVYVPPAYDARGEPLPRGESD